MPTPGGHALASPSTPALEAIRPQVDRELLAFLHEERSRTAAIHPDGVTLVDELIRLVSAGGKRIRPAFCYWGFRAAGGEAARPIVRAAAALELLHTFAIVHDDVIDRSASRRGVPSTHARFAAESPGPGAAQLGLSMAILAGDLAVVLADRLLQSSEFAPEVLADARGIYDDVRVEMAVGELLDVTAGPGADEALSGTVSRLKTGSYTIEGPLRIGATLAGAGGELLAALAGYAGPLGEAFQIRDDLLGLLAYEDEPSKPTLVAAKTQELMPAEERRALAVAGPTEAVSILRRAGVVAAVAARVDELVGTAIAALEACRQTIPAEPLDALRSLARLVEVHA